MDRRAVAAIALVTAWACAQVYCRGSESHVSHVPPTLTLVPTTVAPGASARGRIGSFVPNQGQWDHGARFVHRSGSMTLFLQDRGWVIDLAERPVGFPGKLSAVQSAGPGDARKGRRGAALQMTFEGSSCVPEIFGEDRLHGNYSYFLGNDEGRWRTGVPLYGSVRYEGLYPGIDLRLREPNGTPEYDLLLKPGADLSLVIVHLEGAQGLSIGKDGSLIIETALGPLIQSVPRTWQTSSDDGKREVPCSFKLLAMDRFGFQAPAWEGDTSLTIDPGLIWSTYLGGDDVDGAWTQIRALPGGEVAIAGLTYSARFPATLGAYTATNAGSSDAFLSRIIPAPIGRASLVYSTFLGGSGPEEVYALAVGGNGVLTLAGRTPSRDFPTTRGAYSSSHNGPASGYDMFVTMLDPGKTGSGQLVYSTFLGGTGQEWTAGGISMDASDRVTVAGFTWSSDYPTTPGAFSRTCSCNSEAFISCLDPRKVGTAQLVYSTFLAGNSAVTSISGDARGVFTVMGYTRTNNFPTTAGAYDTSYNGGYQDTFLSILDPSRPGMSQLVYSTFLGGSAADYPGSLFVDSRGVVTLAGSTTSIDFPTTKGAFDTTHNGPFFPQLATDGFVCRLDPGRTGSAQLVYSTFLGGSGGHDGAGSPSVDDSGVVTVAAGTGSSDFPVTAGAMDTSYNGGGDIAICRLDPEKQGGDQLVYSTFVGGSGADSASGGLYLDPNGVVTIAGWTRSTDFPTTPGAFDGTYNGGLTDAFVSRVDMGTTLYGDLHELSVAAGGTQRLVLQAGKVHANRSYWVFGSVSGTRPGVTVSGVHIPLNPDPYTDLAIANSNSTWLLQFNGRLDSSGSGSAALLLPRGLPVQPGLTLYHAYAVYDAGGKLYMSSNPVPLRLTN